METVVEINGRRVTVITEPEAATASGAVSSSSSGQPSGTSSKLAASKRRTQTGGAFHCGLCDAYFWDSAAVAAHKASRRHRENSGELAREALMYKRDADVTADDIAALVERKRIEKAADCRALSEIIPRSDKRSRSGDAAT